MILSKKWFNNGKVFIVDYHNDEELEKRLLERGVDSTLLEDDYLTANGDYPLELDSENKITALLLYQKIDESVTAFKRSLDEKANSMLTSSLWADESSSVLGDKIFSGDYPDLISTLEDNNISIKKDNRDYMVKMLFVGSDDFDCKRGVLNDLELFVERQNPSVELVENDNSQEYENTSLKPKF